MKQNASPVKIEQSKEFPLSPPQKIIQREDKTSGNSKPIPIPTPEKIVQSSEEKMIKFLVILKIRWKININEVK
jgi:hypothetical protein